MPVGDLGPWQLHRRRAQCWKNQEIMNIAKGERSCGLWSSTNRCSATRIADAIGTGLVDGCVVSVIPVAQAGQDQIKTADLVVVGGPTHVHGMTRASTRQGAAKMAEEADSSVVLEPDAVAEGLREWLDALGKSKVGRRAAAFDTRMPGPAALTGRASKGISRALRHHGYEVVADPESFIVTKQNTLEPGEEDRARTWGARLAAILAATATPARGG